jgi:hypothetical protein
MKTYQDLQIVTARQRTADIIDFVKEVINDHKGSERYDEALTAYAYDRQRNTTIINYQKLLYTMSGEAVPDNFSANYKLCSNYFNRFITQENQFLLGNGITWTKEETATRLGDKFDTAIQKAGRDSLIGGTAFGFWNLDHVDVFDLLEFAPLFDEEDGAMKAGVRFWQISADKPLRATLYEMDGYTDFIWNKRDEAGNKDASGQVLHEKRPYKLKVRVSEADGEQIFDGENYPSFPIVPLYGNPHKQSELVGRQEQIDAYDLIKSGFAGDIDDASQIYWTLQNAGGMDDIDLVKFIEHMKTVKAAVVSDDAKAESHTLEVPFESREAILNRLRTDLYDDFMALNTKEIVGGATTATQIIAAYDPLQKKTDLFEYQVREFIDGLLNVAGIDDVPTFTRDVIINTTEEIQALMQSATYLSADYVTEKVLTLLGDKDKVPEVLKEMQEDDIDRLPVTNNQEEEGNEDEDPGL